MQSTSRNTIRSAPSLSAARAPTLRAAADRERPRPLGAGSHAGQRRDRRRFGDGRVVDRDDDVPVAARRSDRARPLELAAQMLVPAVRDRHHYDAHEYSACASATRLDRRPRRARLAAPSDHRAQPAPPPRDRLVRATPPSRRGRSRRPRPSPSRRSAAAVASCSPNGRSCGTTTAGVRAAATSAIAPETGVRDHHLRRRQRRPRVGAPVPPVQHRPRPPGTRPARAAADPPRPPSTTARRGRRGRRSAVRRSGRSRR